ncbi:MAG: serine/threonine protein kinase [Myxococcales bacterium]|nr:serine/threonine protein kinase [Myxococcales bacterium]
MTTRDPRSRPPARPSEAQGAGRDPTQSLSIDPADEVEPSHPSLALGTSDRVPGEERTKIESPNARVKTPDPARSAPKPPPVPRYGDEGDERIGGVFGSYKITELLGKGGMGYVYRAEHVKLGREVAIKLLRTDYAKRRDAVSRFVQEARTVNRIRHRNIVDVPDIVELEDGTTFIVMEFLRGMSLGKWARTGVDLPRALAVLVQICDGLAAAHSVSVVHRDLKPDNVIVVPTPDGAELVKLLDFGVAKLLNRDDEDLGFQTAAGSVIGTPAYMSPEQAGGMPIDHRSDIYSLGAIMYELFCGQPMFRGRSFGEYVRKHLTEMPVRPKLTPAGKDLDDRLEALIMRCLEKDPNARFSQITELRDQLLELLGSMETHPPSFSQLTASGLRPAPLPTLPSQPIPHVPTPIGHSGGHASQVPPHPSSGHFFHPPTPLQYSQYSGVVGLPQPPQPAPAPWWVWFAGGAVAVAIGIAAAVWYAGRTESTPEASPRPQPVAQPEAQKQEPTVTPAKQEPTIVPRKPIEVQLDSLPSGHVYADGKSAELCTTPCKLNIDPNDGDAADKRTFVVKADGYHDGVVVVELASAQREFSVTLKQLDVVVTEKPAVTRTGKTGKTGKTSKPDPKPAETKTADTAADVKPTETRPANGSDVKLINPDSEGDPSVKKPKKDTDLDPSHTLDPFRRKTK